MSRPRTSRPTARVMERLAARQRAARSRHELQEALAGLHGKGVREDVLTALRRQHG